MIVTKLNYNLGKGVDKANEMFDRNSEFMRHYTQDSFKAFIPDMSKGTNFAEIMRNICAYANNNDTEVRLWRPWKWRFSAAIAMTKGKHINMNRYKLKRTVASFVGTIWHELVHIVELPMRTKTFTFWHGNNYRYGDDFPQGKRRTAPYIIGELAKIYTEYGLLYSVEDLINWKQSWDND